MTDEKFATEPKFCHEGKITLVSERITESETDYFIFKISDTGIGIKPEQLGEIFEPFTQADLSITRRFGGTGLGLSISHKLCIIMEGELTAESKEGVGSTFTVRIPSTIIQKNIESHTSTMLLEKNRADNSNNCILVIDDDENRLNKMQSFLTLEGHEVVIATGGQEGIKLAHKHKPSVITLNILMSDLDGWSTLCDLKSDSELSNIPVLIPTILDDSFWGIMLGVSEFLIKPIDRNRLIEVVNCLAHQDKGKALVIDDDQDTCTFIAGWLKDEGWEVATAKNGQEGMNSFEKNGANLIILDLMMPVMDGFEFMVQLNKHKLDIRPKVVVVTAKDLTPEDASRLNLGVEYVINEEVHSSNELLNRIKQHLN